jgi:hypothetical protein
LIALSVVALSNSKFLNTFTETVMNLGNRLSIYALVAGFAAGPALALEVRQATEVKQAPAAVWAKIGEWCAIKDWHPAIATCDAGKKGFRTLTLKDGGGKIVEKLTKTSKYSYSYDIVESPLPVRNYKATLTAKPDSLGTTDVTWTATFDAAKGKTDDDATKAIQGIFEAGLKSIKDATYNAVPSGTAPTAAAAAATGATAAATPAAIAAATRDEAKLKAREERRKRLEAAKVAAMEKYAKLKATIAEKAKATADSAKAAYEKAKAAMSAAMEPKAAEPKKP